MSNSIIWEDLDLSIKNLKHPLSYLYILFYKVSKNELNLDDNNLQLITRLIFKHHTNIFFNYDIRRYIYLIKDKISVVNVINLIYETIRNIIEIKIDSYSLIQNKIKDIEELNKIEQLFMSEYDLSFSDVPYYIKIETILSKKNNFINFHRNEIKERLGRIYKLFGIKFFIKNKIVLISYTDYFYINTPNIIKYFTYIFQKINKIIIKLKNNLIHQNILISKINGIKTPIPLEIHIDNLSSEISSFDFSLF